MVGFMEIKSMNSRLNQKEIAKELRNSTFNLQRYRHDINKLSPYKIPSKSNKLKQKLSTCVHDLERHQLTSNVLKAPSMTSKQYSLETIKP